MKDKAYVIYIPKTGRYFYKITKTRISTAWCLAGAQLFNNETDLKEVETALQQRGVIFERKTVTIETT